MLRRVLLFSIVVLAVACGEGGSDTPTAASLTGNDADMTKADATVNGATDAQQSGETLAGQDAEPAKDTAAGDTAGGNSDAKATADDATSADDALTMADGSALGDADKTADAAPQDVPPADVPIPPGQAPGKALNGNWVYRNIGNCIDIEEWLSFAWPDDFVQVLVDRNACGPHAVTKTLGDLVAYAPNIIEYTWQNKDAWQKRRHTIAVVDPYPVPPPSDPSLKAGKRAINRKAYVLKGPGMYQRDDRHDVAYDGTPANATITIVAVKVTFDKPLQNVAVETACQMNVTLAVSNDPGGTGGKFASGSETFVFACSYGPDATTGWIRVAAQGFEKEPSGDAWMKFMTSKGWWNKYSPVISNSLYDEFRPVFYFQPQKPEMLFHNFAGWYVEMLSSPPTKVP